MGPFFRRGFVSSALFVLAVMVILLYFQLQKLFGTNQGYHPGAPKAASKPSVCTNVSLAPDLARFEDMLQKIGAGSVVVFIKACETLFRDALEAFAASHYKTLKKLLAKPVYESFAAQMEQREERGVTLQLEVRDLITTVQSYEKTALGLEVVVVFSSQQMVRTVNAQGESFDNPSQIFVPKRDVWTLLWKDQTLTVLGTQ